MKRKKKEGLCHALEFARQLCGDGSVPWMQDLETCERAVAGSFQALKRRGAVKDEKETQSIARIAYTVNVWMRHRQCYSITAELADDLFRMDDLSFPLDALCLPFPVFYLDMEPFHERDSDTGRELLGYFFLLDDSPYKGAAGSLCSIAVLFIGGDGQYSYEGATFDFLPEHMEGCLRDTVEQLTKNLPEKKTHLTRALLFAAYLSADEPDITENEVQKMFYRPSAKPRSSSVRKWDVGVRYAKETCRYKAEKALEGSGGENPATREGNEGRQPPRPHIRKAHWHIYRIGPGRKEKKALWMPPITVGIPKPEHGMEEAMPVVIRKRSKKTGS